MRSGALQQYFQRLRLRAWTLRLVRDVSMASAAGALTALLVAAIVGPTPRTPVIVAGWLVVVVATLAPVVIARRRDRPLGGARVAHLLESTLPTLVSAARSARELEEHDDDGASRELREAHRARVLAALAEHPASRVVPLRTAFARRNVAGLGVAALASLAMHFDARLHAGFFALTHAARVNDSAHPIAAIARIDRLTATPPRYLDRPTLDLDPGGLLAAPRGALIEVDATVLASQVTSLELRFEDGRRLPLAAEGGHWRVRFLLSDSVTAHFVGTTPTGAIDDATVHTFVAEEDRAPVVRLVEPAADLEVDPLDLVIVTAEATDDVRIDQLELVITTVGGHETRHAFPPDAHDGTRAFALLPLSLDELRAEPGDTVTVHAEARDTDDVAGPHVGRSAVRVLRLRSEADAAREALDTLAAIRDAAISLLADRIELPVPESLDEHARRAAAMATAMTALTTRIGDVANDQLGEAIRETDRGVYLSIARRLTASQDADRAALRASLERRRDVEASAIRELERTTLELTSLLARARTDDAAAIARELEQLRREMTSLLAQLRRANTPEAMQDLMASIARARRRLDELRARMAPAAENGPREFENVPTEDLDATEEALDQMETALRGDDLEAASRALTGLEQQLDFLARALGQSQDEVTEEHFGERQRALADVLDRLLSLEAEQRDLAQRTAASQSAAAERAIQAEASRAESAARGLSTEAERVAAALRAARPAHLTPGQREAWEAAERRLTDTRDALSTGDLGEARRMAAEATTALDELSRDLELDAMMFPGHDGSTAAAARVGSDSARRAHGLERSIEASIPDLGTHLTPAERAQLGGDADRQSRTHQATTELEARLVSLPMGPTGAQITQGLHESAEAMQRATEALRTTSTSEASEAQDDASRRLTDVRRLLELDQQSQSGGGGSDSSQSSRDEVVIPGASAFQSPMEQRRRVLDAMRDPAPNGYQDAIRRYYEELLR